MCRLRGSNPHFPRGKTDFKSVAYTGFAKAACSEEAIGSPFSPPIQDHNDEGER